MAAPPTGKSSEASSRELNDLTRSRISLLRVVGTCACVCLVGGLHAHAEEKPGGTVREKKPRGGIVFKPARLDSSQKLCIVAAPVLSAPPPLLSHTNEASFGEEEIWVAQKGPIICSKALFLLCQGTKIKTSTAEEEVQNSNKQQLKALCQTETGSREQGGELLLYPAAFGQCSSTCCLAPPEHLLLRAEQGKVRVGGLGSVRFRRVVVCM